MYKRVTKGHRYETKEQFIQFRSDPLPGQEESPGILCQDLIRVLIDRVIFLNSQQPCSENVQILENLRECLIMFETRALSRQLRKHPRLSEITPGKNGHIFEVKDVT